MRLVMQDDPIELEGTQGAVCRLRGALPAVSPRHVLLRHNGRSCGAVVEQVEAGDGSLALDPFLRDHLQARRGEEVEAEFRDFPPARRVTVVVPAEARPGGLSRLVRDFLVGKPISVGQVLPVFTSPLTGEGQVGQVEVVEPDGIVIVTRDTDLALRAGRVARAGVTYQSIGGLGREIEQVREVVEFPLRRPEVFAGLGLSPPRGVILYGPPGTGKTLIAKALAHEVGAAILTILGPEIISGWYGGSEQNLRRVFEQARDRAPSIVLIDELDSIAPRRDRTHGEVEHRVVATLLTLMDGLGDLKGVVVIGTTNAINSIDPALRRPGRFEHEVHVGVPNQAGREEILAIHTRRMPLAEDVRLDRLAELCHGFVGADLASLCRQAAYAALRRTGSASMSDPEGVADLSDLRITDEDFHGALKNVRPSAMREVVVQVPRDVSWKSVGGLEDVKQVLLENVVYGIRNHRAYQAAGIRPARGLLLYGPPGTGKTLLARVVARESGANFIAVRGPEVKSRWFGESEERLRFVFARAREVSPCVILFDEIDAVAGTRGGDGHRHEDSIVNQLLTEMDGLDANDQVFVLGTTNQLGLIDPGVLRPGRFDCQVLVPAPDERARAAIYAVHLPAKLDVSAVDVGELSARSEGLSGADIAEVCRAGVLAALRASGFAPEGLRLTTECFLEAVDTVKRTQQRLREVGF